MDKKNILRHIKSFIPLVVLCFFIPYFILIYEKKRMVKPIFTASDSLQKTGIIMIIIGLILIIYTIRIFIVKGKGTIMPWHPTRKLVVVGLYAYVRSPMILCILIILLGASFVLSSFGLILLTFVTWLLNTIYFIYSEEPGLEKRFGQDYIRYKRNVRRWIPRLTPWRPNKNK